MIDARQAAASPAASRSNPMSAASAHTASSTTNGQKPIMIDEVHVSVAPID